MDLPAPAPSSIASSPHFLDQALAALRWVILAVMLAISLAWPLAGRTGHPIWAFLLVFAAYNVVVEVARRRVVTLGSFGWVAALDLAFAAGLYFFDAEPTGPLFGLFYIAVVTAAVSLPLVWSVLSTASAVAAVALIAPTLPLWQDTAAQLRLLGVRLAILSLAALGAAVLTQRLREERAAARASRLESERLAELDRLRAGFVGAVSHELRTPLTAAQAGLGMLALSAGERLRPDERGLLDNTRRNVKRLGLLIDDLLAANQLEAGALRLDRRPLDLRAVVADALAAVEPLLVAKDQPVAVDLPEPLPIDGDARRLEQVVVNLLANAHQHTPVGTHIAVSGRVEAGEVRLAVRDDGPGIPAGRLERIFERFHRLTAAGGSGLGLSIARSLIELHGGRLWAESEAGAGATFIIALPRQAPGEARAAEVADR
jgi:signal transduction histidine kinase